MDEFVSKKLLVAKFNELASKYIDGDKRQRGLAYTTAADMIALADAADVQPIKHGLWLYSDRYITCAYEDRHYSTCSICGEDSLDEGEYCSYCGARMDGEKNED